MFLILRVQRNFFCHLLEIYLRNFYNFLVVPEKPNKSVRSGLALVRGPL